MATPHHNDCNAVIISSRAIGSTRLRAKLWKCKNTTFF